MFMQAVSAAWACRWDSTGVNNMQIQANVGDFMPDTTASTADSLTAI
jgi:hypothetical protein